MRLYVAGASAEIERAESFIKAARDMGYVVEHDWCAMIRDVGAANGPIERAQREAAASLAYKGATTCDLFVLLLPALATTAPCYACQHRKPALTIGAWMELAWAVEQGREVVLVGECPERTVMTVNLKHIATDDEHALMWLRGRIVGHRHGEFEADARGAA
jgi:hypothetical protein